MWAKQELHRLGITDLTISMAEAENFYDVRERKFDNSESSKPKSRPKCNGKGPRASQGIPWDKKGPMRCYLCQGLYRMTDCLKKATFDAIEVHEKAKYDT
ncbi:hypothetical protein Golob_023124, partial [Gossypium lobatum]|nr:hypothetical protein [Gossypium lobatum]